MKTVQTRVCPVELADSLDNKLRRWLQNPHKILAPHVSDGMSALDVGCGPGFFSIELARLVGPGGRVIAADLQQGMLDRLAAKITGTDLSTRIHLLKCDTANLNLSEPVDFILTFYMVHEVPDQAAFFRQLFPWLRETGKLLLVEPRMFHVSRSQFRETLHQAEAAGFVSTPGSKLLLSRSAILIKSAKEAS